LTFKLTHYRVFGLGGGAGWIPSYSIKVRSFAVTSSNAMFGSLQQNVALLDLQSKLLIWSERTTPDTDK
jgi:hypothetical protein